MKNRFALALASALLAGPALAGPKVPADAPAGTDLTVEQMALEPFGPLGLEELVTARDLGRFVWLMVLLALTPALCEEIVFRGVLLGGTRTLEPWRMIVLNGVVFGAFHLSFETVIRFLPTAALGMLIAWAVWRTGSLWVGALMHFLNNGSIVAITSVPALRESLSDPEAPPPVWMIPLGLALLAAGARLLPERHERRSEQDGDAQREPHRVT